VSTSAGPVSQGSEYAIPRRDQDLWDRSADVFARVPGPLRRVLIQIGQLGQLLAKVVSSGVRQPVGYWGDVIEEMYSMLRYAWMPSVVAIGGFVLVMSNYAYALVTLVGAQSRVSTYLVMAIAREIAPFCTGMAVAGVLGTALTADLGARRVREELDALEVLGIDPVKNLVVPRFLALMLVTGLFNIYALIFGVVSGVLATVVNGGTTGAFRASFFSSSSLTDLWGSTLKTTLFGAIIAIVCCYKGMTASGGAAGVGRAVNQAVVISFLGIFAFNYVFTQTLLATNPELANLR
jgi:phospholipid/cholesterol/gamma-HCH transport system permease protein